MHTSAHNGQCRQSTRGYERKKIVHAFGKSISSGVDDVSGEGCRGTATSFSRGLRLGWEGGSAALGVPAVRRVSALGCG